MTFARKAMGIALSATVLMPLSTHAATADNGRYKLPGHKGKIGTITAFCQGVNRCPDVVNTV